jgi:predicted PurR-regulated permease PerM
MNGEEGTTAEAPAILRFRQVFVLLLVAAISVLFLLVVRGFLLTVLLAAIFAGLATPLHGRLLSRLGGRRRLASAVSTLLLIVVVGLPLAGFLTLVATEAIQIGQGAQRWFEDNRDFLERLEAFGERLPLVDQLIPDGERMTAQLAEAIGRTGPVLMGTLAAATRGTLTFLLQLFGLLYAFFYFLLDGSSILRTTLGYLPLSDTEKARLLDRFVSVTRATLRGSVLIGVIQGGIAGLAFWVAGVPGPAFWGTIMIVLSVIPAVGAALVWIPAVAYLALQGEFAAAVALFAWCAVVVGSIDNFLRPRLIGRDARMSDLLILLSTLGGIMLFGAVGFIVGPIVAALFVSVWHIYGETFSDWLPSVEPSED